MGLPRQLSNARGDTVPTPLRLSDGPDFDRWLSAGEGTLQRTAHLVTGNVYEAQDLVQNTLARLYQGWDAIHDVDDLDAYAYRVLVDEFRTGWRRPGRRVELLVEVLPTRPVPGSPSYDGSREALWDFFCSLPSKQRIAVVLRFYEQLAEAEIADLVGSSVDTVTSQSSRALASLRAWLLDHPEITDDERTIAKGDRTTAEDLLTRTLTQVVETTEYPTTSTATVAARSRALVHARRRATARVVAAAAVLVTGGWVVVRMEHEHATTASQTGHHAPAGSLLDLPQGEAPGVAFLDGDAFVTASGKRVTAPAFRTATTVTTFGDGVLVAGRTTTQRPFAAISLVSGGSTRRLGCGTPSFAVGSGDPAYWLSEGCRFVGPGRLFHGTTITPTTKGVIYSPVGSTSRGVVAVGTVVLRQGAGSNGPVLIAPDGSRSRIPHDTSVAAVSPSGALVAGSNSLGDGVVTELSTGAVQWRTRGATLGHFSPSGRYIMAIQNLGVQTVQGVGDVVTVRDAATGHLVRSTVLPDLSIVGSPAWEGDDSVLVVAEDRHQQQAIVRVGLDGSITRATPVAPQGRGTYRLAATP
jgi:RNA polymerase sigma factor (sigma-70 family)